MAVVVASAETTVVVSAKITIAAAKLNAKRKVQNEG